MKKEISELTEVMKNFLTNSNNSLRFNNSSRVNNNNTQNNNNNRNHQNQNNQNRNNNNFQPLSVRCQIYNRNRYNARDYY